MLKTCSKCKVEKTVQDYWVNRQQKSGLNPSCKGCQRANNKNYVPTEEAKQRKRDLERARSKLNRPKLNAQEAKRRARKLSATPKWLTEEHKNHMLYCYYVAKDCEILTGNKYHVDHIVPLQGENVCGLHVPWNLQVLPAKLNIAKGNSFGCDL